MTAFAGISPRPRRAQSADGRRRSAAQKGTPASSRRPRPVVTVITGTVTTTVAATVIVTVITDTEVVISVTVTKSVLRRPSALDAIAGRPNAQSCISLYAHVTPLSAHMPPRYLRRCHSAICADGGVAEKRVHKDLCSTARRPSGRCRAGRRCAWAALCRARGTSAVIHVRTWRYMSVYGDTGPYTGRLRY